MLKSFDIIKSVFSVFYISKSRKRGYMRKVAFYFFVLINVVKSLFMLIHIKMVERRGDEKRTEAVFNKKCMNIIKSVSRGIRLDYEVKGRENIPDEACLFVANHQSYFDILSVIYAVGRPVGFVAKEELKKIPYFRTWIEKGHAVFINRKNPREGLKAINKAADNLKSGHSMAIFPEGTRSRSSDVAEFKKGSMKVAIKAQAKIIPVALDGAYKAYEKTHGFGKVTAKVVFGEPIDLKEMSREEMKDINNIIRNRICELKEQI